MASITAYETTRYEPDDHNLNFHYHENFLSLIGLRLLYLPWCSVFSALFVFIFSVFKVCTEHHSACSSLVFQTCEQPISKLCIEINYPG